MQDINKLFHDIVSSVERKSKKSKENTPNEFKGLLSCEKEIKKDASHPLEDQN